MKTQVYPTSSREAQILAEVRDAVEENNRMVTEQNKLLLRLVTLLGGE